MTAALLLRRVRRATLGLLVLATPALAQSRLTTPQEALGFNVGDDYMLATYSQLTAWWQKLDAESNRMRLVSIGKTAEGRDQWMAIITSPANFPRLDHYREIAERLARAEGLNEEQARALAREGKAVVWIDGGLHSTEVLGAHQLMEHVWQMVSQNDPETLRILEDVIQLLVHANPDGMELVSGWYMRNPDPTRRSTAGLPRLYQKYIGHDNNRDFYLNAMPESENMSRVLYREWYPQIMYNHHQTGPAGTVMFAPPFRDPHNHNLDPLVINGISLVGAAMHARFAAEGKPGTTMREGASYQTWWNGGLRTTAYFHNMIGILTETIGSPTPMQIPLIPERQLSTGDLPFPITPRRWHFRQSVDYSITANRAILDLASRYRESLLYNIYLMGRRSIEAGSRDSWTTRPGDIVRLAAVAAGDAGGDPDAGRRSAVATPLRQQVPSTLMAELHRADRRDPRGYILPSDQPDFPTATKFVDALLKSGIDVHRATAAFSVNGKRYPAGSWVVKTAQAFRPHVLDMFEPQDYPNDLQYPGGPPKAPYDNAGYTLALQMGVQFDRILDGFDGPFEKVPGPVERVPGGTVARGATAWLLSPRYNDAILAVNRLHAANQPVYRVTRATGSVPAGALYIPAGARSTEVVQRLAEENGLRFEAAGAVPEDARIRLQPVRVALWDVYGGSMPSGWIRWLLEQQEVPFQVVYAPRLDAGNLRRDFDVLILPSGAVAATGAAPTGGPGGAFRAPDALEIPAEYRAALGRMTVERTVPRLREFLEAGGRIITIGSATGLANHLGLPVGNHLVERTPAGEVLPLPQDKFYVPTSVLEVAVDTTSPAAWGMPARSPVTFNNNPVFTLDPGAVLRGELRPLAWFPAGGVLRSGWAWGEGYLEGGIAAVEARVGRGSLLLFGPEITFRAQPHATFKFLFNGLMNGAGEERMRAVENGGR
jgi:hypothetical protein